MGAGTGRLEVDQTELEDTGFGRRGERERGEEEGAVGGPLSCPRSPQDRHGCPHLVPCSPALTAVPFTAIGCSGCHLDSQQV